MTQFSSNPAEPTRWLLHGFFALLAWFWIFHTPGQSLFWNEGEMLHAQPIIRYPALFLIAIFFVFFGNWVAWIIDKIFAGVPVDADVVNLIRILFVGATNTIFVPVWTYYAYYATFVERRREPTAISRVLLLVGMAFLIIIIFTSVARAGYLPGGPSLEGGISPEQREQAAQALAGVRAAAPEAAQGIIDRAFGGVRNIILGPRGLIASAVGEDIYASQVDKNKHEPLGVYLENLQPSSDEYYEDEPVSVWATLKAKTLDPDKGISVTVSCSVDPGQLQGASCPVPQKIIGDTNPDTVANAITFDIFGYDQQDVGCNLPANKLLHGFRTVTFNAEFNFNTMAYVKAYFMENSRLRALRRENIDPLNLYGVTDKNPVAVFSNGPVAIGMITTQPLIGIDEKTSFRLGVSLNNRWEGKIKRIKKVVIKVPDSMELYGCDLTFTPRSCDESRGECEDGKYVTVYELSSSRLRQLQDIKRAKSFNCNVKAKQGQLPAVLGNVPLMTHYFKAAVDYDYELEKAVSITMKHPPDKPGIEPPGLVCPRAGYPGVPGAPGVLGVPLGPSQYDTIPSHYIVPSGTEQKIKEIVDRYGTYLDEAVAANPNVPKALMIGFIVQESGGDPLDVSTAGAVGLVQLMPHTSYDVGNRYVIDPQDQLEDTTFGTKSGVSWNDYSKSLKEYLKQKLGVPAGTSWNDFENSLNRDDQIRIAQQLAVEDPRFDPRQNVMMATMYISRLLNRFNNDFHKTTVGYNAGPGKVEEWVTGGQWQEFVNANYPCSNPNCDYGGSHPDRKLPWPDPQNYANKVIATMKLADKMLNPQVAAGGEEEDEGGREAGAYNVWQDGPCKGFVRGSVSFISNAKIECTDPVCCTQPQTKEQLEYTKQFIPDSETLLIVDGARTVESQRRAFLDYLAGGAPACGPGGLPRSQRLAIAEKVTNAATKDARVQSALAWLNSPEGQPYKEGIMDLSQYTNCNHVMGRALDVQLKSGKGEDKQLGLRNIMCNAGWANLGIEWWHYEYLTKGYREAVVEKQCHFGSLVGPAATVSPNYEQPLVS